MGNLLKKLDICDLMWLSPGHLLIYSETEIKLMKILFSDTNSCIVDNHQELRWRDGRISNIQIVSKNTLLVEYIKNFIRNFTFI